MNDELETRWAILDDQVQEVRVYKWSDNGKFVRLNSPAGRMMTLSICDLCKEDVVVRGSTAGRVFSSDVRLRMTSW